MSAERLTLLRAELDALPMGDPKWSEKSRELNAVLVEHLRSIIRQVDALEVDLVACGDDDLAELPLGVIRHEVQALLGVNAQGDGEGKP